MRELKNTKIIAVDHGYGNMKTANTVTPTGIKAYETEPIFTGNILEYNGIYYRIGEGHKEFIPDKAMDEEYYLLTLMAIARELNVFSIREADVHLAAGLPLTWIRNQREAFRSYLLQNPEVHYRFNGKEYHLHFAGCSLYPQGYPAIVNHLGNFKGTNLLADIGNGTMNILYINNRKAQESRCWTEKLGVNQCMIAAKNAVLDKFGVKIEESTVAQILVRQMQMGIYGAALATILGLVLSFSMGIYYFIHKQKYLSFTLHNLSLREATHCMINGASEFVDQLAIAVTTIVFNRTALSFAGEDGVAAVSIIMYLQFLFIGVYFGFSMGMAPPLSYAYGDRKIRICRKLESYAHRFFTVAPIVIYTLTYFLAPISVSCFADTSSPVFPIAVSGMRVYGLGFLFSGINIFAAIRMMAYGKGYFSGLITFLRSFLLLLLFLIILPLKFGLTGVWLAVPAAEALTLLVAVWFLQPIHY